MNPRSAPRIVIRIDFEATRPKVVGDYLDAGDEHRMADWLQSQPLLLDLVEHALALAREEQAA